MRGREPNAEAARMIARRVSTLIIVFKDMGEFRRRDASPGIGHIDRDSALPGMRRD